MSLLFNPHNEIDKILENINVHSREQSTECEGLKKDLYRNFPFQKTTSPMRSKRRRRD